MHLEETKLSPRAVQAMGNFKPQTISEIEKAMSANDIVVVGMAMNPFVIKARKTLTKAGVPFKYLEFGHYFNNYSTRVAIKMWTGWPTFPQVFVKGTFIGGADDLLAEMADGTFQKRMSK
jgi:monothiol glutaredoxin